jgi:hypothetical protein
VVCLEPRATYQPCRFGCHCISYFHDDCFEEWAKVSGKCVICRTVKHEAISAELFFLFNMTLLSIITAVVSHIDIGELYKWLIVGNGFLQFVHVHPDLTRRRQLCRGVSVVSLLMLGLFGVVIRDSPVLSTYMKLVIIYLNGTIFYIIKTHG